VGFGSLLLLPQDQRAKRIGDLDLRSSIRPFGRVVLADNLWPYKEGVPNPWVIRVVDSEALPLTNYLENLRKDARKYQAASIREQVLLSFTTDVYNPFDTTLIPPTIEILREFGLGFCVLTKGGTRALVDIDLYRPLQDAFASTLTSLDDAFSLKGERAASLPGDRMAALKAFHSAGIFTWCLLSPRWILKAA
jgi:DNA repair photolyase